MPKADREFTSALYLKITHPQHAKLRRAAERRGESVAWVVRRLIDRLEDR